MKSAALVAFVVGPLVAGHDARADDARASSALDRSAERRSGLIVGAMGGWGLAGSSGFPNNATKIDDPAYYSASGLMGGSGGAFFLMGALTDYLNFGIWFGGATFGNSDWHSTGGGGGFRVEVFPLYAIVPMMKDLGIVGQFGLGGGKLESNWRAGVGADGGESFVGTGVFYEFNLLKALGGHVAAGPSVEYDAVVTRSMERHWATVGGRFAFYGGM